MTARRAPWLAVVVIDQFLGDNEPLVGDLLEESSHRSRAWFWRQVMFAVHTVAIRGASAALREPQRLGGALSFIAVFIVLSFQVVVAGSLLDDLIQRPIRTQMTRINHPEWLMFVFLVSVPAAWAIGRVMSLLHRRSRIATILVSGASAAVVSSVTLSVLSSESSGFFFPSAALQTAAAMVFVLALLVGGAHSFRHTRQASS